MALPLTELLLDAFGPDNDSGAPGGAGSFGRPSLRRDSSPDVLDAALVRRLRAGDGSAYEDAIRTYYEWLRGVAMRFVGSSVAAEEIVDGAFVRAWERRESFTLETRL